MWHLETLVECHVDKLRPSTCLAYKSGVAMKTREKTLSANLARGDFRLKAPAGLSVQICIVSNFPQPRKSTMFTRRVSLAVAVILLWAGPSNAALRTYNLTIHND